MVAGLLLLIATHQLFSVSPVAILLQGGALLLMIWARITFGRRSFHLAANPTEGGLVTTGPYRFIRHPIYAGVCLFTGVGVVAHWSWFALLPGAVVLAGTVIRVLCEEQLVQRRYPEYSQYASKTWRLVPFVF